MRARRSLACLRWLCWPLAAAARGASARRQPGGGTRSRTRARPGASRRPRARSYRDLRGLLEQSFADLVAAQQASPLEHVRAELGADSGDELDEQSLALRGMLHGLALDGDALGDRSDDSRHFGGRGASAEHLQLRHGAGGGYREPSHRELGGALSGSGLSAAPRW